MQKKSYVSPHIEVIEVENEGVMALSSDNLPNFDDGGNWWGADAGSIINSRNNNDASSDFNNLIG